MPDRFVQVWHCRWIRESDLRRHVQDGALYLRAARLEADLTRAYEMGLERGEYEGRRMMRRDIEEGVIEPIVPDPERIANRLPRIRKVDKEPPLVEQADDVEADEDQPDADGGE
jgi:hypothetical protein